MPVYPDENFLHEIFASLPIPNRAEDEVEKPRLIALHQGLKGPLLTTQERGYQLRIVQGVQLFFNSRARRRHPLFQRDVSHSSSSPKKGYTLQQYEMEVVAS